MASKLGILKLSLVVAALPKRAMTAYPKGYRESPKFYGLISGKLRVAEKVHRFF